MTSPAALFAEEISGTKEKTFPAWIELNVVLYKRKCVEHRHRKRADHTTYHEGDEEVEGGDFETGHQSGTIPEDESDNVESHRLRQSEDSIAPHSGPIRATKRLFQRLAVESAAILLTGEGGNSTDRTGGFASKLSGFFVGLLVLLILEDNDALHEFNQSREKSVDE